MKEFKDLINFNNTYRFLENKIVQNLTPNFHAWYLTTYGCSVHMSLGYPEGKISALLHSILLDIEVATALRKTGFDTPCRTMADLEEGKIRSIPHASILKFQEEHREEIQEWLNKNEQNNFLANPEITVFELIAARGKGAA
ncbi:MAG: hypothetical protein LBV17_04315 [Treponema sp.]|jgi:hypothetical protein|nr:hypothetical protein [Treponema sp.]